MRKFLTTLAAVAAVTVGFTATVPAHASPAPDRTPAAATAAPGPGTVGTVQLKDKAVTSAKIAPASIFGTHFTPAMLTWFTSTYNGTVGPDQFTPAVRAQVFDERQQTYSASADPVVIANVGGTIITRGTDTSIDLLLPAGKYAVEVSGQINRTDTAATAGKMIQPQLSLYLDANNDGQMAADFSESSISPNGIIPDLAGRSVTVFGKTVVTLTEPTHLRVKAMAYEGAGVGDSSSGQLKVGSAAIFATPTK